MFVLHIYRKFVGFECGNKTGASKAHNHSEKVVRKYGLALIGLAYWFSFNVPPQLFKNKKTKVETFLIN